MTVVSESIPNKWTTIDDCVRCRECETLQGRRCPHWCSYSDYTDDQKEDIARCTTASHLSPSKKAWIPGRYRSVYIEQSRIKAKHARPIRVDDRNGLIIFCAGVTCQGPNRLVYSPDHKDGSCLWFESDSALILTDPEIGDPNDE